jgi:ABC-type ATPase with predicted acetyltransferase domain
MSRSIVRTPAVGEDIACPAQIESAGTIRIRSERAAMVARLFGLSGIGIRGSGFGKEGKRRARRSYPNPETRSPIPDLPAGTITLLTGPSGAGKSMLLRAIRARQDPSRPWIDLPQLSAPDLPLVDCFGEADLRGVLELLARVGLSEAWSYLRTPAELSEGQRWRLKLAMALHAAAALPNPIIACDEFAALLDRVTAMVVAHRLRRAITTMPHVAAVVATSHDDLGPALAAEVIVRCDFGGNAGVSSPI